MVASDHLFFYVDSIKKKIMPQNYIRRPTKHWSQKALEDALVEQREQHTSLRKEI